MIAFTLVFLFCLAYVMVRASSRIWRSGGADRLLFFTHFWRIFFVAFGTILGTTVFADPRHSHQALVYQAVANFYIFELMALFAPVRQRNALTVDFAGSGGNHTSVELAGKVIPRPREGEEQARADKDAVSTEGGATSINLAMV
jgi:hypothetical protein